jgi:hypothetical protein
MLIAIFIMLTLNMALNVYATMQITRCYKRKSTKTKTKGAKNAKKSSDIKTSNQKGGREICGSKFVEKFGVIQDTEECIFKEESSGKETKEIVIQDNF